MLRLRNLLGNWSLDREEVILLNHTLFSNCLLLATLFSLDKTMESQEMVKFKQKVRGKHVDSLANILVLYDAFLETINHNLVPLILVKRGADTDHFTENLHLFAAEGCLDVIEFLVWLRLLQTLLY